MRPFSQREHRSHAHVPEGYERWLMERLGDNSGLPPVPAVLREAVLGLQHSNRVLTRRHLQGRTGMTWSTAAIAAIVLCFSGMGRVPHFLFTPVQAGIERVGSAVVTREHFNMDGELESKTVLYYRDRSLRIESEDRTLIATPSRYWELDRISNEYREELRPNDISQFRDYFALPELQGPNGQTVRPQDDPTTADPNDMLLEGFDAMGARMKLRVDKESRLVRDWTVEVRTPEGWSLMDSGRIQYGVNIDRRRFSPKPPPGSRPKISADERYAVRQRLETTGVSQTLAGKRVVLRDVFRNSEGDLFWLLSLDPALQPGLIEVKWRGEGANGLVSTLHSFTADYASSTEGPQALRFPEGATLAGWKVAEPGKTRPDEPLQLHLGHVATRGPGAPPPPLERVVIDAGVAPISTELFPDWMELAASPLSRELYWARRAIALASVGGFAEASGILKAIDEALAKLPKRMSVPTAELLLARGKTLALLGRKQEALEALDRADYTLRYDQHFRTQVQGVRADLLLRGTR